MKHQYIEFKISHQQITRTDDFFVVGGSKGYLRARFSFCEDWADEPYKYAIFTGNGRPYPMLIEDGECEVPWEVLRAKRFYVGCAAGLLLTSNAARIEVCPCGMADTDPALEPTPTMFATIMNMLAGLEVASEEEIAAAVAEYMTANHDAAQLAALVETDMLPAVHDASGAILTDENGNIILRY